MNCTSKTQNCEYNTFGKYCEYHYDLAQIKMSGGFCGFTIPELEICQHEGCTDKRSVFDHSKYKVEKKFCDYHFWKWCESVGGFSNKTDFTVK
jgi:hypothetical protein